MLPYSGSWSLGAAAGNRTSIHTEEFPVYDEALCAQEAVTIGVQVNGKLRGEITLAPGADEEEAMSLVRSDENLASKLVGEPRKIIYKPGKILNIIV